MSSVVLYDYWRSSTSYRVRISLNLADIDYRIEPVNLLEKKHKSADYLELNPQGLVPTLLIDDLVFTQSLSIIEYLNETYDLGFLPEDALLRQRARALAYAIAVDIHPICNISVSGYVKEIYNGEEDIQTLWQQKFITRGLDWFESLLATNPPSDFCFGPTPGLADICLVPQVYNAERWSVDLSAYPKLTAIAKRCNELPAFRDAHPDYVK